MFLSRRITSLLLVLLLLSEEIFSVSDKPFDFIVVGGGTAGCALASRLSENGKYTVLLLEAGKLPDPNLEIPALSANISIDYIKQFASIPQRNAGLRNNGRISYSTGWTLGGGSSVNMMFFNRGSPYDYDNWALQTGDVSWSYQNMLKYFRRIEDYQGDYPSDQHGYGGPITVSRPTYSPGEDIWLAAGKYLGYPTNVDQNGPQQISFTTVEFSKRFGRRVSSYTGYIKPVLAVRPNLKVMVEAQVTRIVFEGNRAIGVVCRTKNTEGRSRSVQFFVAKREIILTAGVMSSPAILLRSGIGPREVLEEAGITPVKYLPVGKNLQDHVAVPLEVVVGNNSITFEPGRDLNPETWKIFNLHGDGPYTSYGGHQQAFIRSPQSIPKRHSNVEESDQWANIHLALTFGGRGNPFFLFRDEIKMAKWETAIQYSAFLTRPKSRGSLKLNKTDVESDPVIDFQYLSHPQDLEDMLYGLKLGLQVIGETPSFGRISARYPPNPIEGCKHITFRTDEYWLCYIRQMAGSGAHAAGTCRMGRGSQDPDAVVDTTLKVIGIENVRVVDTSIMLNVVNSNTQVAAYAIAEKAADMILRSNS